MRAGLDLGERQHPCGLRDTRVLCTVHVSNGQLFFLFFEGLGRETSPEGVAKGLLGGMAALFSLDDPQVARRASYPSTGLGLVDNFCRRLFRMTHAPFRRT